MTLQGKAALRTAQHAFASQPSCRAFLLHAGSGHLYHSAQQFLPCHIPCDFNSNTRNDGGSETPAVYDVADLPCCRDLARRCVLRVVLRMLNIISSSVVVISRGRSVMLPGWP